MLPGLKETGWAVVDGVETTSDMLNVACGLGRPLRAPTGELIKALTPIDPHKARPGTLSAECGLDAFPFHTDTAFWPRPTRYVVMRVVGDQRRSTKLLHFEHVWLALGRPAKTDVLRSVWRIEPAKGGIYCSMNFSAGSSRGWRFDSKVMKPTNASSRRALENLACAIRDSREKVDVSWETTSCLVIDNWHVLHARGAALDGECGRKMYRIYVT